MIGYYAHHQGRGHVTRARAIGRHLDEDVVVLSSLPREDWAAGWVELPRDDDVEPAGDPTAGGRLHWAPQDSPGYRDRMAHIAGWVREARPRAMVVDVSVEVTVLVRLLGVPVATFVLPGEREDAPHALAHDVADRLLVAWPDGLGAATATTPHLAKTDFLGVISRYEGRPAPERTTTERTVLLLGAAGGSALTTADLDRARATTPGWHWAVAGPLGRWRDDVWPLLHDADVVVTAAGQGAIADVATARRPAVVLPQDRPHGEQAATGRLLAEHGLATVLDAWPDDWASVLEQAADHPDRWHLLRADGAAARAAAAIEALA